MKVAVLKEYVDPFGPWSSVKYSETSPEKLLSIWPCKPSYFEMTTLLKADWYILPIMNPNSWFIKKAALYSSERKKIFDKYVQNITILEEIPFEEYDVIISLNPIIQSHVLKPLFCYYLEEHADPLYILSLRKPCNGYDLFLDHMMWAPHKFIALPQSISFPYLCDPDTMRTIFKEPKEDAVWIDSRTILKLANVEQIWNSKCEEKVKEISSKIDIPSRYNGEIYTKFWKIDDPPQWKDALLHLKRISKCKFYISIATGGPGQSITQAASLGCICIGSPKIPYHKMICHPMCLSNNISDAIKSLHRIVKSSDLQKEIIKWQDNVLYEKFNLGAVKLLAEALDRKQNFKKSSIIDKYSANIYGTFRQFKYKLHYYRKANSFKFRKLFRNLK